MQKKWFLLVLVILILSACININVENPQNKEDPEKENLDVPKKINKDLQVPKEFVGFWRVFSERIFYDIGGAGALGIPVTRNLEIKEDGTWQFGTSTGTWEIANITDEDWKKWGIDSYGPTRKITFNNWNNAVSNGPIEETNGRIDFIWSIYHVEPHLVQNPGTVWIKFGQA